MKSRIFALILAVCCLSLLFVACDKEACTEHVDENKDLICDVCGATVENSTEAATTEPATEAPTEAATVPPCDAHVDEEPADQYCDVCGRAVVVVFLPSEPGEAETRVEMEVITAPADANISDYVDLGAAKNPAGSMEEQTEGIDYDYEMNDDFAWVEENITEMVTSEMEPAPGAEPETEAKVIGTRYDVVNMLTGEKIIPTITVGALDFDLPFNDDYDTQSNGFAVGTGYVYATNVGGDQYNNTDTSYTLTFYGSNSVRLSYDVSSEGTYDYLRIELNGNEQTTVSGTNVSGEIELYVSYGDTITLKYHKDSSVSVDNEHCRVAINLFEPHGVTVTPYDYFFIVTKTLYSATEQPIEGDDTEATETVYSVTVEKTAYTYKGVEIAQVTWTAEYDADLEQFISENGDSLADLWKLEDYDISRDAKYAYLTYDGTIYLIDKTTYEMVVGGSTHTFVGRPEFDYENEFFGYVVDDYTLYVYDLSKWLECVYTYTVPGYFAEGIDTFLLENGNLLLQALIVLPDDAVSYDLYFGDKYDIVYILIDPAAKTATEIEFGYWIDECITENDIFTDKATNVFVVHPISQSMFDNSAETILVVDNNMNALCALPVLDYAHMTLFGNDYLRVYNDMLDCYEILDKSFNLITYVPDRASFYANFFKIDNLYYTIVDGKIQALDTVLDAKLTGEYNLEYFDEMHMIYREVVEIPAEEEGMPSTYKTNYYVVYVGNTGFALTKIGAEKDAYSEVLYEVTDFGYITRVLVYAVDENGDFVLDIYSGEKEIDYTKSYYAVYSQDGKLLGVTKDAGIMLENTIDVYDNYLGDGVYTLTFRYSDEENGITRKVYVIR